MLDVLFDVQFLSNQRRGYRIRYFHDGSDPGIHHQGHSLVAAIHKDINLVYRAAQLVTVGRRVPEIPLGLASDGIAVFYGLGFPHQGFYNLGANFTFR